MDKQLLIAGNPKTSGFVLNQIFESTKNSDVIKALAGNPGTPGYVLNNIFESAESDDIVKVIGEKIAEKKYDRAAFVRLRPLLGHFNWAEFLFMIGGALFGIHGILLVGIFMLINLSSYDFLGMPYLTPFALFS